MPAIAVRLLPKTYNDIGIQALSLIQEFAYCCCYPLSCRSVIQNPLFSNQAHLHLTDRVLGAGDLG